MSTDVRMSGFRSRSSVSEALYWLDNAARAVPRQAEKPAIEQCTGRVLMADVVSPINVPAFDRSAMDGFAVRATETTGASDYHPLSFNVIGSSFPGRGYGGEIEAGDAVRIMTGAPIPRGADAVVPAEYAQQMGDRVELTLAVAPSKHIGRIGEDIKQGAVVLKAGRRLRPQDIGVLASIGCAEIEVVRQPLVRILVTGNELVLPGEQRAPEQIFEANSFLLRGLITRDGGILEEPISRVSDACDAIKSALTHPGADLILISGGTSVGSEDFAPMLVAELGELAIHGIAMRPSSPTGLGKIGEAIVCLLPGNPVSCLCAYDFFAGRVLRTLAGHNPDWPHRKLTGILNRKVVSSIGRVDYCRVSINGDQIEPLAISGASILSSTTRADGFLIIPESSEGLAAGSYATAFLY